MTGETAVDEFTDADLSASGPIAIESWLGAPALSYPRRPCTVVDVLRRAVRRWPDAVAFVDPDGGATTYARFAARVAGCAAALLGTGLRPGDRVAVAGRNSTDMAVAAFACAEAGLVMVGLNTRLAPAEWVFMLRHAKARLALAEAALRPVLAGAAADAGLPADRVRSLAELTSTESSAPLSCAAAEADTYAVVWTSGSTGRSKASRVVHRCSIHSGMTYQRVLGLRPGERTAVVFPLYYISALHAHVLPAMLAGATSVLVAAPEPARWLRLLAEHEVAWAYAVPSWWMLATRDPGLSAARLPHLRVAAAGGSPFPEPLLATLRERLPGTRLIDVYGLSETHSPATMLLDGDFAARPGSVGRALPCMEVEVRDDAGCPVPAGEPGEVWLRGSLVTTGYLDDPEATAAAIRDGWFRTGDVGRLDAGGYLFLLDRVKDMINRGGAKVFSAEVERVLRQMPGVADGAVVAAPDAVAGEAVAAFVVPAAGARISALDVKKWVRAGLADYAAPTVVRFVPELPRNAVGKTDKPALRAALDGG